MTQEKWKEVNPNMVPTWNGIDPETKEYKLKIGDELIGTFEKFDDNVGPNNSNMYTIKKEDGTYIKVWGSSLIDSRMEGVNLGEKLKFVYEGTVQGKIKGRKPYHSYKVYHAEAKHPENKLPENDEIPVINEEPPMEEEGMIE
jgi:hypothetical protein